MLTLHPVMNTILNALASRAYMSAKELHQTIIDSWQTLWHSQLYEILLQLKNNHVISKHKTLYTLHPWWVSEMISFGKSLEQYTSVQHIRIQPGMKEHITCESFAETNIKWPYYASLIYQSIWVQTQVKYSYHNAYIASGLSDSSGVSYYLPHQINQQRYYGWKSRLDHYTASHLLPDSAISCRAIDPTKHHVVAWYTGYNINIIGEYLIQIHISDWLREGIEEIYQCSNSLETFDREWLRRLLTHRTPCQIIIVHDPVTASLWKKALLTR
jgi:hypothetical protein